MPGYCRRQKSWIIGVLLISTLFAAVLSFPANSRAQKPQEPTDDEVLEIAEMLNCPTCQGINLADCATVTCAQWKEQIKDMLRAGKNREEVLAYFSTRFGERVLQDPPKRGLTLLLWYLPLAIILVGSGLVAFLLVTWSRRQRLTVKWQPIIEDGKEKASEDIPGNYLERVEKELKDF